VHCSSRELCQLSKTCRMFRTVAPNAATAKLCPSGFFSAELCQYLDDFGGKTCNSLLHSSVQEMIVCKLHETALTRFNMLSIKLFDNIIKNEVQIHGVRLITDFYKRKVLLRHEKSFSSSSIKTLFYYETTMSKIMDLVMLQGILCDLFQKSIDMVTEFASGQPVQVNSLRDKKIDGTNITQVLNSMMTWTETRSLMDELDEREFAIAWPPTSITHRMLQAMLGTTDFDNINLFMTNILTSIQLPFSSYADLNSSKRKFALGTKSCNSNFFFFSGIRTNSDNNDQSYMCVMDLTEGNVMCREGRMAIKIRFDASSRSAAEIMEIPGVWILVNESY